MSKILITGGCGFIGANLVDYLNRYGHDIIIYDNLSRGSLENLNSDCLFNFIEGDIRDKDSLKKAISGVDTIVHLAAYGSVVESVQDPIENFSINVTGTFNVLNAARESGIKQIVFASTGGALIGNAQPPVNENSLPRPISPYGASKLAGEGYCCAFSEAYDISITALRFANIIGPISWHKKGAVTAFFKAIMNNEPIKIFGDGNASRDFLYVTDLCKGISSAIDSKLPKFNALHLASGNEITVNQLAKIAIDVSNKSNHPIQYETKRQGEVERNFANFDLANNLLNWTPSVTINEAMNMTWDWFINYSDPNP